MNKIMEKSYIGYILLEYLGTPLLAELINFVTAVVGLAALVWGIHAIRKELMLRGADAACGFLAQLKANLANLQLAAYSPGGSRKVWHSVFISFCDVSVINNLKIPVGDVRFAGDKSNDADKNYDWLVFEECAKKTLKMFDSSNGQMPLSKAMFINFIDLQMILQDMLVCKKHKLQMQKHKLYCSKEYIAGPVDSEDSVKTEMNTFDKLIGEISDDIDIKTQKLMRRMWRRLKTKRELLSAVVSWGKELYVSFKESYVLSKVHNMGNCFGHKHSADSADR